MAAHTNRVPNYTAHVCIVYPCWTVRVGILLDTFLNIRKNTNHEYPQQALHPGIWTDGICSNICSDIRKNFPVRSLLLVFVVVRVIWQGRP